MESFIAQEAGLSACTVLDVAQALMAKLDQMVEDESISEGDYTETANFVMQARASLLMLFNDPNVPRDEIVERAYIELFGESSDEEDEEDQEEPME